MHTHTHAHTHTHTDRQTDTADRAPLVSSIQGNYSTLSWGGQRFSMISPALHRRREGGAQPLIQLHRPSSLFRPTPSSMNGIKPIQPRWGGGSREATMCLHLVYTCFSSLWEGLCVCVCVCVYVCMQRCVSSCPLAEHCKLMWDKMKWESFMGSLTGI